MLTLRRMLRLVWRGGSTTVPGDHGMVEVGDTIIFTASDKDTEPLRMKVTKVDSDTCIHIAPERKWTHLLLPAAILIGIGVAWWNCSP